MAQTPDGRGLRAWLAHETSVVHEALHHHPRLVPLSDGSIGQAALARVLEDYRAVYGGIEQRRLARRWCAGISLAPAAAALADDLNRLPPTGRLPRKFDAVPDGELQCLGALYVMLGAQFGGHVLGRRLEQSMPEFRSAYFSRCPATLTAWRKLMRIFDETQFAQTDANQVLQGAHLTFEGLHQLLSMDSFAAQGARGNSGRTYPLTLHTRGEHRA